MKLYLATSNLGKVRELQEILHSNFSNFSTIVGRAAKDADETADSFLENARIKARALMEELRQEGESNFSVLADDSGLCVDALGGAPGVISARYAGDHVAPEVHMKKLLNSLAEVGAMELKDRVAHYHCSLVLLEDRDGKIVEFVGEGQCFGRIGFEPRGQSGFGYDPIFMFPDSNLSFSEVSYEEKNKRSHRTQAIEKLRKAYTHT